MGASRPGPCAATGGTGAGPALLPGDRPVSRRVPAQAMIPIALTIAGSDPSGGAGIQADLKTFHQLGVYGTAVVTLVTVQNTVRMSRVETLEAGLVGEQLDAVLEDFAPHAIKTGAMGTAA